MLGGHHFSSLYLAERHSALGISLLNMEFHCFRAGSLHVRLRIQPSLLTLNSELSTFNFQPSTTHRASEGGGLLVCPGNYLSLVQSGQLAVSHHNLAVDDDRFDVVVTR